MICLAFALLASHVPQSQEAPWVIGIDQLSRLDLLPSYKRTLKIGAVTSYDRTEGNDDGFSGKYSFVRKEGENLVLADLRGPGCIYRIHTPTPTDDPLEFYFDGEASPRIRTTFRELYSGKLTPFERPLVDGAGGGFYSYVPIPYKKSVKILLRAKSFQFYDLNYATYPDGAPVQTFDLKSASPRSLSDAKSVFSFDGTSEITNFNVPKGSKLRTQPFDTVLAPGKAITLFKSDKGGRIAGIRLGPAEALISKDRNVMLRITWDGDKEPAVFCPAGDFFGYAWGRPAMGSRLVGTRSGTNYCYLPMPYDRSARVELVSLQGDGTPVSVRGEVIVADATRKSYEGKFYAVWHRENPTTTGKPFTFLSSAGRGHIVGLALQSQGMQSGGTPFFEGDDQTTVDGELVVHGTGSEDFFNGGWYDVPGRWDGPVARALSGCMAYQKHLGRTGAYRFFIGDAYSYRKSILQTIEHGPERNETPTDYCSVTYLYSESRPVADFTGPTKSARTVVDPERIIFAAHWAVPIRSFAFNSATLSRCDVPSGSGTARVLSLRAKGGDFFGPPFVSLTCELPAAGKYKVYVDAVKGPDQGMVQMFQDESTIGESVDLYAEKPGQSDAIYLGEVNAHEGNNDLMFKIVGKNAASKALGFDLVNVVCVKSKL